MTQERYSSSAIILHWLIALALLFQMSLGGRLEDLPRGQGLFEAYQLHKTVGIAILLLSLLRLAIRFARPRPPLIVDSNWAQILARAVHWGLYLIMIGGPLTGWVIVSTAKIKVPTLVFNIIPWPHLPLGRGWHEPAEVAHGLLATLGFILILLHIAGALRHQFIKRENLLARMIPLLSDGSTGKAAIAVILALAGLGSALALAKALPFGTDHTVPKAQTISTASASESNLIAEPVSPPTNAVLPPTEDEKAKKEAAAEEEKKQADAKKAEETKGGQAGMAGVVALAPAPMPLSNWKVMPGGRLGFTSTWMGTPIPGRFDRWDATIKFSPHALQSSNIKVVVDLASASTGTAQYDESLKGSDFFNVAARPQAVFTSSSINSAGDSQYRAVGTLELNGITRPITIAFTLKFEGDKAVVSGGTSLDRISYGVGKGEWAATDQIGAPVKVNFSFSAVRK